MEVEHQKKSTEKKRRRKKGNDDVGKAAPISTMGENCLEMNKQSRKKKRKNKDKNGSLIGNFDQLGSREVEDGFDKQNDGALNQFETQGKIKSSKEPTEADAGTVIKTRKSKKVKKNKKGPVSSEKDGNILESGGEAKRDGVYHISSGDEDCSKGMKNGALNQFETQGKIKNSKEPTEADAGTVIKTRKSKKVKKNKKDPVSSEKDGNILESGGEAKRDGVYHISSGDEDCSKGMKKWVMEYHQSRPGLKILQQRIDDFIMTHEAQQEQERKEKEARAAEGGWTVVVHHKGRKKTTDSESGITVGSVAQAAVEDKMAKKKRKDVGLDFYRFQRREAKRNEVMLLQSKFEQDRKRIQQLRAARKFRPY